MSSESQHTAEDFLIGLRCPESGSSCLAEADLDDRLSALKINAVSLQDEQEANRLWCAQAIVEIQRGFAGAFAKLKSGAFYDAWCAFERCEITLNSLSTHFDPDEADSHRLKYIRRMVERWQGLYPYKLFASPELLKKRIVCSVCGSRVTPRASCGHRKGDLYKGELCYHIVEEVDILSVSVVEQPVQRYSVLFLVNEDGTRHDHYDYGNIKFVVDRLSSPFHEWTYQRTVRFVVATDVAHLSADHRCPCMSDKNFGECCMGKQEFEVPHLQINFSVAPPRELPNLELLV